VALEQAGAQKGIDRREDIRRPQSFAGCCGVTYSPLVEQIGGMVVSVCELKAAILHVDEKTEHD